MILGYVGYCEKIYEDDTAAVYSYSGQNWNDKSKGRVDLILDGEFTIKKCCLENPEFHYKTKKRNGGRKYVEIKRITHYPNVRKHLEEGNIIVDKRCIGEFKDGLFVARCLLIKIFDYYQLNDCLPEKEAFIQ